MYFLQGDSPIQLGEARINDNGTITLEKLSSRVDEYGPVISMDNPCWESETSGIWRTYFGGKIGLEIGATENYFFAETENGLRTSGKVILKKGSKWNIYPYMAGREFFFVLTNRDLTRFMMPMTLTQTYGMYQLLTYPLVTNIDYIVYRINDTLAFQLVGSALEQRTTTFMELGYPDQQTDAEPRYFDVLAPDSSAKCKVLSISDPHWDDLDPLGFTVYVKSSDYTYFYVYVIPGKSIESGYFRTITENGKPVVHKVIFGTTTLSEARRCSVYLYKTRLSDKANYLEYCGFVFAFNREMEENGELHEEVLLNKGMTYLLSMNVSDSCYIVHNVSSKDAYEDFAATQPYKVNVKTGTPKGPHTDGKDTFAAWSIRDYARFGWGGDMAFGFTVVHPGEIIIDYDSPRWEGNFEMSFDVSNEIHYVLSYTLETRTLLLKRMKLRINTTDEYYVDKTFKMNIPVGGNPGDVRNPIIMFYRDLSDDPYYGEYGLMAVSELSQQLMNENNAKFPEELAFYDTWNFGPEDNPTKFITSAGINTALGFYSADIAQGLKYVLVGFEDNDGSVTTPPELDKDKTDDFENDYQEEYRPGTTPPIYEDINATEPPKPPTPEEGQTPTIPGQNDTEYKPDDNNTSNTPQIPDGSETKPSDQKPSYDNTSDDIETPEIPEITGNGTGLISLYLISPSNIATLSAFLWSDSFLDIVKKYFFSSPVDAVINLSYGFITPEVHQAENIILHHLNTGASAQRLMKQISVVEFGYVDILRNFASFMDYNPKTRIEIFLPFIGNQVLETNLVMGARLHLQYVFDFFTGSCVAHIWLDKDKKKFVAYSFNGNFLTQIPVTSENYNQRVSTLLNMAATVATKDPLLLLTSNPLDSSIHQTGQAMSNFGALSVKEPYILITRPTPALVGNFGKMEGFPSYETGLVEDFSGFTVCSDILLDNINLTYQELEMIRELFKEGVYL